MNLKQGIPSIELSLHSASGWIERLARLGYFGKGVVYVVLGVLATMAAVGARKTPHDAEEAIAEIGDQPFGRILLAVVALGLVSHVFLRIWQAMVDPEREGHDVKGLIQRLGYAASGMLYAMLALSAVSLAIGWGRNGSGDAEQRLTARLLEMPFGWLLVGIVGAIIVAVGLWHFYRAYQGFFLRRYQRNEMGSKTYQWAKWIGQFGLSARGLTFILIGGFFIKAAATADATQSQGLGGALATLAAQPYGTVLLGIVALGFVAYGIYCFSNGKYRRFRSV